MLCEAQDHGQVLQVLQDLAQASEEGPERKTEVSGYLWILTPSIQRKHFFGGRQGGCEQRS